jgi:hypothetical protein
MHTYVYSSGFLPERYKVESLVMRGTYVPSLHVHGT